MPTAGCMRMNAAGRVLVTVVGPVTDFNGGTPTNAAGVLVVQDNPPEVYLGGFGFRDPGPICARQGIGLIGPGGFARDSIGQLALAITEPIAGYIAGIPVVEDGRVAVAIDGPPIDTHGFSDGFDLNAFD